MARRRRRRRRNSRGRFASLYRLLAFVAICAAILTALALFFKVEDIEVIGASRYSAEEVVQASGVAEGSNLYLMNKREVAERITSQLNYVETVRITRKLPSTLRIHVEECADTAAIAQDEALWLLSGTGKIVEKAEPGGAAQYALITGVTLVEPQVGRPMDADSDTQMAAAQLLELLGELDEKHMLGNVQEIHLEDASIITLRYSGRFTVQIPWGADMDYKLSYLAAVVERLEDNESGTINMTQERKVNFIPG